MFRVSVKPRILEVIDRLGRAPLYNVVRRSSRQTQDGYDSPNARTIILLAIQNAQYPASQKNVAGTVELGFTVPDIEEFHKEMDAKGVQFTMPPTKQDYGGLLARFMDSGGGRSSVATQQS